MIDDLVAANRILYDQGVVDGFGHVSARHDKDPNRYLLARSMAPALVTADDIMEFDLDSNPVDQRGRRGLSGTLHPWRNLPGATRCPAVVHSHSPAVLPFADTKVKLRPINHIAGFLGGGVPVFEIRDVAGPESICWSAPALGRALAKTLGAASGCADARARLGRYCAVGTSRRVPGSLHGSQCPYGKRALRLGEPIFLNDEEAAAAMTTNDGLVDRPWTLWKRRVTGK